MLRPCGHAQTSRCPPRTHHREHNCGPVAKGTAAPAERARGAEAAGGCRAALATRRWELSRHSHSPGEAAGAGQGRTGRIRPGCRRAAGQAAQGGSVPELPGQRRQPPGTQGHSHPAGGSRRAGNAILWSSLQTCSTGCGAGRAGPPGTPSSATAPSLACAEPRKGPPRRGPPRPPGYSGNTWAEETAEASPPTRHGSRSQPSPCCATSSRRAVAEPCPGCSRHAACASAPGQYNSQRRNPKCCTSNRKKVTQTKRAYFS